MNGKFKRNESQEVILDSSIQLHLFKQIKRQHRRSNKSITHHPLGVQQTT